jgi:PAS domain S-box-containing protein
MWISLTLAIAATTTLAAVIVSEPLGSAIGRSSLVYTAVATTAAARVLLLEAMRSVGVKARRTQLAAGGTLFLGASFGLSASAGWFSQLSLAAAPILGLMQGLALICYYFAFATPRPLLSRWRRAEQSKYLATVMDRDPEARGERAGDDLFQAAARGAGGVVTLVALGDGRSRALEIAASSDARLVSRPVVPGDGLAGLAFDREQALMGAPADCEAEIAAAVLPHGERVLVAPIVATNRAWGVVVVAQRRGSLFPEDDLAMLAQVARNAATALDHADLIRERREEERRAADRRLRQIESRVELMLDSIKDYALLVLDAAGHVTAWHPGAEHVFGHPRATVVGRAAADLYALTPAEFSEWLDEARLWGSARREAPCRRLDGSEFIGTTIIRPLVEDQGGTPGFVVVTHDVTDRRRLEERLRQGQKMEAIGQLAGGVAHDFNNLLTAILGYADWLSLELVNDRRQEQVAEIQKAADRAAELTRQLLAFSRRQMLQPAAVDLNDLVADLLPMLRRLVGDRIRLRDEMTCLMPTIMADRSQIERVIVNLAVNARDAMPEGGQLTIRTSDVWLDNGWSGDGADLVSGPHVLLEVIDTGVGMSEDVRRRVFEPFFTTKDVGSGTGLGLSTAYGIVQQMGGAIEVQSEPNRGAQFRVYLPQASEPAVAASARARPADVAGGSETVLLVEDDAAVRTYLTRLLETHGYRVIAADDAARALALTQTFGGRIDLVISDVVIAGSTGPELVRLLNQARPGLSALFMSGHADAAAARHAPAVSADRLLLKPFSSTELLAKIREILAAA